ncbi:hypothetical protein WN48_07055 [Eufriesea mexicana]|uniref:Uncharacterized protein n=1 Tax=Eufriesea mexicana TaxID=516756 RepID=A0A310SHW9_9HYME|nr:hypothetical protein WN48_07055 [Eufriesea mexicana]
MRGSAGPGRRRLGYGPVVGRARVTVRPLGMIQFYPMGQGHIVSVRLLASLDPRIDSGSFIGPGTTLVHVPMVKAERERRYHTHSPTQHSLQARDSHCLGSGAPVHRVIRAIGGRLGGHSGRWSITVGRDGWASCEYTTKGIPNHGRGLDDEEGKGIVADTFTQSSQRLQAISTWTRPWEYPKISLHTYSMQPECSEKSSPETNTYNRVN